MRHRAYRFTPDDPREREVIIKLRQWTGGPHPLVTDPGDAIEDVTINGTTYWPRGVAGDS